MSVMEHSHRGKVYEKVHSEATALVAELLGTPLDTWDVLFVQGGASMAFAQIPMNFLGPNMTADYVVTGAWGEKAVAEARTIKALGGGEPHVAASTKGADKSYVRVPKQEELTLTPNAAYLHVTSNETIHGVEYAVGPEMPFPKAAVPIVVDMSSDILGRRVDASQFDMIYAGAQKNIGPAGLTIVIVRDDLIGETLKGTPTMFDYKIHADNESMYNTPPTFAMYTAGLVFKWLKKNGGLAAMEKTNREKAGLLYSKLDSTGFYNSPVAQDNRSLMNVPFTLKDAALDEAFLKGAKERGLLQLKGHRSVGGMRASIYNAMPLEGVRALVDYMDAFEKQQG